ncbi:MAG TPA: hypothetical protein VFF06_03650 [Polyangia bacterium]|nr:hypothetical protein [Polyangia bacterium]
MRQLAAGPPLAASLALALSLAAGCASSPSKPVSLAQPAAPPPASEYVDLLKRWTRHGNLIQDFDTALNIDATFHSPEFQEVYADQWAKVYRLDPPEAARVRAQLIADIAEHYEFFAESATHKFELNDFTSAKTVWRVSLRNDQGHEVLPSEIKLAREQPELLTAFYPYTTVFSRGWRIRFPNVLGDKTTPLVTPETKALTLRIAGPQGSVDLVWSLK